MLYQPDYITMTALQRGEAAKSNLILPPQRSPMLA